MILPRLQLPLRDFLMVVAIISVALALGARFHATPEQFPEGFPEPIPQGLLEGLLTGVGLLLLYFAVRMTARGYWWIVRGGAVLIAAGLIWFATVDYAHHSDWCGRCGQHAWTASIRVYRVPVKQFYHDTHTDLLIDTAADLGVPCQHEFRRDLWLRFWGLVYPYPAGSCTCCLSGDLTYADIQPYVQQMARENPELPAEYHRAFMERDIVYLKPFFEEVRARRAAALQDALD